MEKEAHQRMWQEFEDFKRSITVEAGVRPIMGPDMGPLSPTVPSTDDVEPYCST